jgi:hypothetical protein
MIKLIVTASNELYDSLSEQARAQGHAPRRARTVVDALGQALDLVASPGTEGAQSSPAQERLGCVVVDMALHAADTLLEALHSRPGTQEVPLLAIRCQGQPFPLALRRLCRNVLEDEGTSPRVV